MVKRFESALAWVRRNERALSSVLLISGFITDLLTFGLLELDTITRVFFIYICIALLATLAAFSASPQVSRATRAVHVVGPLITQFILGSVLSGFLILFTRSAALAVSWPFVALLVLMIVGNEAFRTYRGHLMFQSILIYFCVYAFAIFALPLYVNRLGQDVFLYSTAIALSIFMLFIALLAFISSERMQQTLQPIVGAVLATTGIIVGLYVTGILPPIPLALKEVGIYQQVVREGDVYARMGGHYDEWWDPRPTAVLHAPGTPLYAYTSIFAPGAFSADVVHIWERYDANVQAWVPQSTVAFTLSGGREDGYRGYTIKSNPLPGEWRLLVETLEGQTIGDYEFNVIEN